MVVKVTAETAKEMTGWDAYQKMTVTFAVAMEEAFEVETLEGTMKGSPGDFLCMAKTGEVWPVKRDIFLGSYRPALPLPMGGTHGS